MMPVDKFGRSRQATFDPGDINMNNHNIIGLPRSLQDIGDDTGAVSVRAFLDTLGAAISTRLPAIMVEELNMKSQKITNLGYCTGDRDAAPKRYVDQQSNKRCFVGYIPSLNGTNDESGFRSSASSNTNDSFKAFSNLTHSWEPSETNTDSWIKIECPDLVKVWQIRLKANNNTSSGWKFEGSIDNSNFTTIASGSLLDIQTRTHTCENNSTHYNTYRLVLLYKPEAQNPKIRYIQIFVHCD
jgi:hypothetical protein